MDYSAVSTDNETLHGSSPWGSSSPRADRSGFAPTDSPPSPVAAPRPSHAHTQSQDSITGNPFANEASAGGSVTTAQKAPTETGQPALNQNSTIPPTQQVQPASVDPQPHLPTQQPRQEQARPGAARYHSARQNRPVPAYKLQAKVTALERSGRKDPVIRFDVYVC